MTRQDNDVWFASLREVRRQVKYIADATGLGSQVEGQAKLFNDLDSAWEVSRCCPSSSGDYVALPSVVLQYSICLAGYK